MEELELLKKDWNTDSDDYKNYSEEDLFKMIKRKSFSISKTLLVIGLLEICFWMLFNYFDISKGESFFSVEFILRTLLFVVFIGLLFYSFINIKNETNAKKLMIQILNLRKVILTYIFITFFIIILFGIINMDKIAHDSLISFIKGQNAAKIEFPLDKNVEDPIAPQFGYFLFFITFSIGLIILYFLYKRIYGRLLEKLKANYKELSKIEKN